MVRSCTRLDHAFVLASALLPLLVASFTANAGNTSSEAQSGTVQICQAAAPTPATGSTTEPSTEEAADDDFFSWIHQMVQPTTNSGQTTPAVPKRPNDRGNGNHDHGGGGGHGGGSSH